MVSLILNRVRVINRVRVVEPVDNSNVEIEESNKLYIHTIDTENPKLKKHSSYF